MAGFRYLIAPLAKRYSFENLDGRFPNTNINNHCQQRLLPIAPSHSRAIDNSAARRILWRGQASRLRKTTNSHLPQCHLAF